jgi:adenylosuccinate synthase
MPGWTDSTVGVTEYDKLPVNARLYLQRIEQVTGVPITWCPPARTATTPS